jgi:hypothetical protein
MSKIGIGGLFLSASLSTLSIWASASDQPGTAKFSTLPAVAQAKIAATLGRDTPSYFVKAAGFGIEATNPAQKLTTGFTSEAVELRMGSARWVLALYGYGHGNALTMVEPVAPSASANRVEYRRGPLTEWYVNGPVGLEQGFTLNEQPVKAKGQPLTIVLTVSGNMKMSLDKKRTSLSLRQPDGSTVLRYTGLTATDARGKELPAWLEVQGQRLLLKVDDAKARYPVLVDPWVQLAKLTPSDCVGCAFITSVAIGGDTVVASGGETLPEAYVFVKPASGWGDMVETAILKDSDGGALWSVAISSDGNTVVAGSPSLGLGYVFVKPSGGWVNATETAKLIPTGTTAAGWSVSMSGNTVILGDYRYQGTGAAYVFEKPASGWTNMTETAILTPSDGGGWLGFSVAISGDTVVAGAQFDGPGAAYVFVKPVGGWTSMTETAKLTVSHPDVQFGDAVSISGDTIAASEPFTKSGKGIVFMFVRPASGWISMTETAALAVFNSKAQDNLGWALALGPTTLVAAAVQANVVYVFRKPANGWRTTLKPNVRLSVGCNSVALVDNPPTVVSGQRANAAYLFALTH